MTFFIVILIIVAGCDYGENIYEPGIEPQPELITPSGGVIHALNGDVTLSIPSGAIDKSVVFSIRKMDMQSDNGYLIQPVVIEPFIVFNKSAVLEIRYNGSLEVSKSFSEDITLEKVNWESIESMCDSPSCCCSNGSCLNCTINTSSGTVKMCACRTGVFTVKIRTEE